MFCRTQALLSLRFYLWVPSALHLFNQNKTRSSVPCLSCFASLSVNGYLWPLSPKAEKLHGMWDSVRDHTWRMHCDRCLMETFQWLWVLYLSFAAWKLNGSLHYKNNVLHTDKGKLNYWAPFPPMDSIKLRPFSEWFVLESEIWVENIVIDLKSCQKTLPSL